jgi:hypothetical protein
VAQQAIVLPQEIVCMVPIAHRRHISVCLPTHNHLEEGYSSLPPGFLNLLQVLPIGGAELRSTRSLCRLAESSNRYYRPMDGYPPWLLRGDW